VRTWTAPALVAGVVAGVMLLGGASAAAHHSFTAFWFMDKMESIEGTVVALKIVNPHPTMTVEVTDATGRKEIWTITARATATAMVKGGWTPETLTAGTRVRVEGAPPRREGTKGLAAGPITRLTDGKVLSFGGSAEIPAGE
jgi:hypothetical protein